MTSMAFQYPNLVRYVRNVRVRIIMKQKKLLHEVSLKKSSI